MTTEESRKKQTEAAELDTLRAEIDRLDQELVERIHARSKVAMAIGEPPCTCLLRFHRLQIFPDDLVVGERHVSSFDHVGAGK